jgi:bacteriorhodopsin
MLKKVNRGLVWGALQASIIIGVCCWLWQDSNAVMGKFLFFILLFLIFTPPFLYLKFLKNFHQKEKTILFCFIFFWNFLELIWLSYNLFSFLDLIYFLDF